jgi:peptidyl-prolyl cis-trans isomerase A (cyclophilin A)
MYGTVKARRAELEWRAVTKLALFLIAAGCLSAQQRPNGLYAVFHTAMGDITAKLYEKETPVTVENFVALAEGTKATRSPKTGDWVKVRLYDNVTFHRVLPGEVIQAGDPTGTGAHNCGFTIPDEFMPGLRFSNAGMLAMANTGRPDSGGCQFFITDGPVQGWDGKYTIFGVVVEGQSVVSKISRMPVHGDRPVNPVKLIGVTIERVGPEPVKKKRK